MVEQLQKRRSHTFYHPLPVNLVEETVGHERYQFLTNTILTAISSHPQLSLSRSLGGNLLYELYNQPWEAREAGYSHIDVLVSIATLQSWLISFGLVLGREVEAVHQGEKLPEIDPAPKYKTYPELLALAETWRQEGKVVGLAHGSFDPPHIGHARLLATIWPHCDILLCGFDPNESVRQRKGEDRPRFSELAWRMWETASLPTPDYVFVLPFQEARRENFCEMYKRLGIRVLGCGKDHPLLPEYRLRMRAQKGGVVIESSHPGFLGRISSTMLTGLFSDADFFREWPDFSLANLRERARVGEIKARAAGYLRDYPSKT